MADSSPSKWRRVKTPTVLQMEAAECGAAALGIILEFHGRYVPLDVLRDDCGVSRDGSNAFYIKEAAKRYGLEVKAFRKSAEGIRSRRPPFIVFWQWNHFLVVEGFGRGKVYLNDPASGRRTIGFDEFERGYSGIAFTFEPGPQFVKEGRRPSIFRGLARRLSTSKTAIVFVVLAGLALVIPNLVTAAFQRVFIDEILIQGHHDWLKPLLLAMALTAILRLAAAALRAVVSDAARGQADARRVAQVPGACPAAAARRSFSAGTRAIWSRGFRARREWPGLHLGRAGDDGRQPADPGGLRGRDAAVRPAAGDGRRRDQQSESGCAQVVQPLESRPEPGDRADSRAADGRRSWGRSRSIESIKATGSESEMLVRWTGDQARMINAEQTLGVYDALLFVIPPLLASLTTIVVLGLGGRQVIVGGLSIGVLLAFQSLLAGFNQPFRRSGPAGSRRPGAAGRPRSHRRRAQPADRPGLRVGGRRDRCVPGSGEAGRRQPCRAPVERAHRVSRCHLRLQPDGRGTADPRFLVRCRARASALRWSADRGVASPRSAGWPPGCISPGAARSSTTASRSQICLAKSSSTRSSWSIRKSACSRERCART